VTGRRGFLKGLLGGLALGAGPLRTHGARLLGARMFAAGGVVGVRPVTIIGDEVSEWCLPPQVADRFAGLDFPKVAMIPAGQEIHWRWSGRAYRPDARRFLAVESAEAEAALFDIAGASA
jgi:hypothetical protein